MRQARKLAIFDLDYTLTAKGTWGRFTARCMKGHAWRWPELALRAVGMQAAYKLGLVPRIAVKTQMMRVCMTGRERAELEAIAEGFAEDEVARGLRPGGVAVLRAHQEAGDRVMIASAAVDVLVAPIARGLGVEDWVATEMAWDGEGGDPRPTDTLSDHFASPNCYGAAKLAAVEAHFARDPAWLKPGETFITMYSDSSSDVDLFTLADDAVAVHPSAKLRRMAENLGWRVVEWNAG